MFISILERVDILRLEIAIVSTFHIASVHRIIGGKCKIGLFVIYRIRDIIFISQSICYSIVISPRPTPVFPMSKPSDYNDPSLENVYKQVPESSRLQNSCELWVAWNSCPIKLLFETRYFLLSWGYRRRSQNLCFSGNTLRVVPEFVTDTTALKSPEAKLLHNF